MRREARLADVLPQHFTWDLVVFRGRDGNYVPTGLIPGLYPDTNGTEPSVAQGKVRLRIFNEVDGHYTTAFPPSREIGLVAGSTFTLLGSTWGSAYDVAMIDPIVNGSFGTRPDSLSQVGTVGTGFTMNAGETWSLFLVEHVDDSQSFAACRDDAPPVGGLEPCVMSP